MNELGTAYDLVSEVPEIIQNVPAGYVVRRISEGQYELVALPTPEPEPDPLSLLEEENALLALELVQTQLRLDQVEQEQADLLLLLVSEGVV